MHENEAFNAFTGTALNRSVSVSFLSVSFCNASLKLNDTSITVFAFSNTAPMFKNTMHLEFLNC